MCFQGHFLHLVAPPWNRGDNKATGRVPLNIRGHVVLSNVHHGAVWCVNEGKRSIHAAQKDLLKWIQTNKHTHKKPTPAIAEGL